MHFINFTTFLLTLPQDCKEIVSKDVVKFHLPRVHHDCPYCGSGYTTIDKYRSQTLHGIAGETTYIYNNRRYRCTTCHRTFSEKRPFLQHYQRMPESIIKEIIEEHGELLSAAYIARRHHISAKTVMRHFAKALDAQERDKETIKEHQTPCILSMDEFRGNVDEPFQVALHDLETRKCIDIFASKGKKRLQTAIQSIAQTIREQVKTISIDLSTQFHALILQYFPNACIAADHFHAVHLANEALNKIRIEEQKKQISRGNRQSFRYSRKLLLSRPTSLSEETKKRLEALLAVFPRIRVAYALKEEYFTLFESKTRKEFYQRISAFDKHVTASSLAPFKTVLKTTHQWKEEIWHGIQTGYNNGFTEGCNNIIKVLKRICFGFRNFKNFRRRVLYILNNPERRRRREKLRAYKRAYKEKLSKNNKKCHRNT